MEGRIKRASTEPSKAKMPVIGNIRIGEKVAHKSGGKDYPVSLDYFKATGNYAAKFNARFGDKPTKIPICFPSENVVDVCHERFEAWDGGKRLGFGDGITFQVFDNVKKDYVTIVVPENIDDPKTPVDPRLLAIRPKMKRLLTLRFIIPEIDGVYGTWRFDTAATKTSIDAITSIFDFVRSQAGRIAMIPFDLTVTMHESHTPLETKRFPIVQLIPNLGQESIDQVSQFLTGMNTSISGIITEEKIKKLMEASKKELLVEEAKPEILEHKKELTLGGLPFEDENN